MIAGRTGQSLGIHTPVIAEGLYTHNAPGQGRKVDTTGTYRKTGKYRAAGTATYNQLSQLDPKILKQMLKDPKTYKNLIIRLLTKGKAKGL